MTYVLEKTSDRLLIHFIGRKIHATNILLSVVLLLYIGASIFFAFRLNRGIVPDEATHIALSEQFASTFNIPTDSTETYQLGPISHRPYLYYWINGRVINLVSLLDIFRSDWRILITLRLVSVFYSTLSVLFGYLIAKEIIKNPWWQILVVFLLTNTLMFVFLSAGVNYDSLTNLCCFSALYFLVRVLNGKDIYTNSLGWLISILIGALVKITVLPLAVATLVPWGFFVGKNRTAFRSNIPINRKTISLFSVVVALLGMNFTIYGVNLIKYQSVIPTCDQLMTQEQCLTNPVFRRDVENSLPGRITLREITAGRYQDPVIWFYDQWFPNMLRGVFGIVGHRIYNPGILITFHQAVFLWIALIAVRYTKTVSRPTGSLVVITMFYSLMLFQTNYNSELTNGFKHLGIQGRYLFPILGILFVLAVDTIARVPNKFIRRGTAVFVIVLFSWGSPLKTLLTPVSFYLPRPEIPAEQVIGEIISGTEVSQIFTSECSGTIDRIELRFATYKREITSSIGVSLLDLNTDRMVMKQVLSGDQIMDNAWNPIDVPPFSGSWGTSHKIHITSPDGFNGNAFTIWSSLEDGYGWGQANINGQSTATDLSFRYRCHQPTLADWLN